MPRKKRPSMEASVTDREWLLATTEGNRLVATGELEVAFLDAEQGGEGSVKV